MSFIINILLIFLRKTVKIGKVSQVKTSKKLMFSCTLDIKIIPLNDWLKSQSKFKNCTDGDLVGMCYTDIDGLYERSCEQNRRRRQDKDVNEEHFFHE